MGRRSAGPLGAIEADSIAKGKTMDQKRLDGKRIAIPATNGVEQVELLQPRQALDQAGART